MSSEDDFPTERYLTIGISRDTTKRGDSELDSDVLNECDFIITQKPTGDTDEEIENEQKKKENVKKLKVKNPTSTLVILMKEFVMQLITYLGVLMRDKMVLDHLPNLLSFMETLNQSNIHELGLLKFWSAQSLASWLVELEQISENSSEKCLKDEIDPNLMNLLQPYLKSCLKGESVQSSGHILTKPINHTYTSPTPVHEDGTVAAATLLETEGLSGLMTYAISQEDVGSIKSSISVRKGDESFLYAAELPRSSSFVELNVFPMKEYPHMDKLQRWRTAKTRCKVAVTGAEMIAINAIIDSFSKRLKNSSSLSVLQTQPNWKPS